MIHILLVILKIIGFILLGLLGILILLSGCVLFAPIRYKGEFSYQQAPKATLKIRWLFLLLFGTVKYDNNTRIMLRILGIPFYDSARRNRKVADDDKGQEKTKGKKREKTQKEKKAVKTKSAIKDDTAENVVKDDIAEKTEKEEKSKRTKSKEKISIRDFLKNILYTIKGIYDKLKQGKENISYYIEVWKSDEMSSARTLIWSQLLYLLKVLKPEKMKGCLEFGFEDPSLTGYGMAVYGVFFSLWGNTIDVIPDFENACFQANVRIKGKIRTIYLIKVLLKLYFSQDVRKTISCIKKEK